jgi:hypothetical protein
MSPNIKKIVIAVLVVFGLIFVVSIANQNAEPETRFLSVAETEQLNPTSYLYAGGKYDQNFFGTKYKIHGLILNKATITTYKDVIVEVTYYSRTQTPLKSVNYTIYEFYSPNSQKSFDLKIPTYKPASSIGWKVIGAVTSKQE